MNKWLRTVFSIIDALSECWLERGLMVTNREPIARDSCSNPCCGNLFSLLNLSGCQSHLPQLRSSISAYTVELLWVKEIDNYTPGCSLAQNRRLVCGSFEGECRKSLPARLPVLSTAFLNAPLSFLLLVTPASPAHSSLVIWGSLPPSSSALSLDYQYEEMKAADAVLSEGRN